MPERGKALYYHILNYSDNNLELLRNSFDVIELLDPRHDSKEILKSIEVGFAPLGYRFDRQKILCCPRLRVIASNTTGVSHVDIVAAEEQGIKVCSLADDSEFLETITATAEHTWGLLLTLLRKTPWSFTAVLEGAWNRFEFGGKGMLSRMTLGIVGFGRLGKMVANYGKAFGMQVLFYDPFIKSVNMDAEQIDNLEELVSLSDIVTLHVPANKDTYHLIDRNILSKAKEQLTFL